MRTLHLGLRVADLERSLAFYATLGYEVVGSRARRAVGAVAVTSWSTSSRWTPSWPGWPLKASTLTSRRCHRMAPTSFRTAWITDPDGKPDRARAAAIRPPRRHGRGRLLGRLSVTCKRRGCRLRGRRRSARELAPALACRAKEHSRSGTPGCRWQANATAESAMAFGVLRLALERALLGGASARGSQGCGSRFETISARVRLG
jgi:catechol 2,3-dioxygenase-like lactoylglutathione lyase family enzyme